MDVSGAPAAPHASVEKAQQRSAEANDSDDDDIFSGAGKDFEDPVAAAARAREQTGAAAVNGHATGAALFGSDGRLADLPPSSTAGVSQTYFTETVRPDVVQ